MPSQSQAHLAYLALERLIVTLKLKPGTLVTERQLLELANHGRTPVREAIQKLAWQGLIEVRPRVGLEISRIRPDDRIHVMQTRQQLEPVAAALVAEHASADARREMSDCRRQMLDCAAHGDLEGFLVADKMFDEVMEEACPNRFLTAALSPLQTHARRIWFASASPEKMKGSVERHVKVMHAIEAADAAGASASMSQLMDYLAEG
ncbi:MULTISPECIES: GntR family transcriptional regulator [Sinorhizobium]|uniref:GntR family transcriptional regulator n=2 Tax=Sinorhizobium TaxID=28105 RepID=A0A2S3YW18_9HYPH|nr:MULTISPECIES: GntR family transcriptional regulator [Sinorhizobium]AUX76121.1 GntR family transcriptional regulator protein [Sinorhizobium fredii]PDT39894.1 GntR family transcriptional regulator [Sinorhizobium sp. FG01]PDT55241.1 GntR family transcriptional regulator [Sinorhizobium sp. NG07B]POH32279.1 GntR family transcriptional regulator [Sinorhizobium americanum]POH35816.1 GntR family transcriptional regulator [Sinorhizobium americanum]